MKNRRFRTFGFVFLIALFAVSIPFLSESLAKPQDSCTPWPECKNGDGGGKTTFDFDVSLSTGSIAIEQGASGTVDITVSHVSGSGNVSLAVTDAPSGVIASADPSASKLSPNSSSFTSTLAIDVASFALPGFVDLMVEASGKGNTNTAILSLEVVEVVTPPPPPGTDPVIVAVGDIACSTNNVTNTACHHKATSDLALEIDPDAVLVLGDLQYCCGSLAGFNQYYDPTWGRLFDRTYPAPGNHEYKTTGAAGYYDYFGELAGDPKKGYYSFDLGAWHVVSVNSNCGAVGGCGAGSPQGIWLENDLAANTSLCTAVFWHHPRFSASAGGPNVSMDDFWKILDTYGVDVNLVGHHHNYQRFTPMDGAGLADPNGVTEFLVGTGGKSLHDVVDSPSTLEVGKATFGVLKMILHPTGYDWEYIEEDGTVFDSGTASCH